MRYGGGETLVFVAAWESSRGDGLVATYVALALTGGFDPRSAGLGYADGDRRARIATIGEAPANACDTARAAHARKELEPVRVEGPPLRRVLRATARLMVDRASVRGAPVLPMTSSLAVQAWVEKLGPVSGGTPAVELPGHGVFLALGHVKLFKKKGSRTATSKMMYKHPGTPLRRGRPLPSLARRCRSRCIPAAERPIDPVCDGPGLSDTNTRAHRLVW